MTTVTLGYWKIRGLAQYLRHLLSYTETEFQEIQYDNQDRWFKEDKLNLGLDFPNIPYLIDGDFKLTESSAIAKYIIKRSGKTDLLGKNTRDQGKVDALISVINDALKDIRGLFWNKDHETLKIELLEKARPKFNYIKDFVGDRQFALGYLTLVDFVLAENLAYFETLFPSEHKTYDFWWRIRHNFEELPGVKAYYKRPDAIHGPYLPPHAALAVAPKKLRLAYWGIRGLAQTPRHLLAFCGVPFEDFSYTEGDNWFKEDKLHLGLDFPNLPYIVDGEYNLTESSAIQRYIIKKWGNPELLGKTIQDSAQIESFLSVFLEVSGAVKSLFFNKDHETAKGPLIEKYKPKLDLLSKFVGEKSFALGYLTLVDFNVAEDSNYIEAIFPEESKAWTFMKRIRDNFNSLPEIVAYQNSEQAFKGRFYPPTAFLSVEKA